MASPRIVGQDPYIERWGTAVLPSGERVADMAVPSLEKAWNQAPHLVWYTPTVGALRKSARTLAIVVGLLVAACLGAVLAGLQWPIGGVIVGALAAWAATGALAWWAQAKTLRGEVGHSYLRSDPALHGRETIVGLLEAAVAGAGVAIRRRVAVNKSGTLVEWKLAGGCAIVFSINRGSRGSAFVNVTTKRADAAENHELLKGQILRVLRQAQSQPDRALASATL